MRVTRYIMPQSILVTSCAIILCHSSRNYSSRGHFLLTLRYTESQVRTSVRQLLIVIDVVHLLDCNMRTIFTGQLLVSESYQTTIATR